MTKAGGTASSLVRMRRNIGTARHLDVTLAPAAPGGGSPQHSPAWPDVTPGWPHTSAHALLQEVDAQLEAEVLLLQVIEVLGQSHDIHWSMVRNNRREQHRARLPPLSPGTWCSCSGI